MEKIKDGSRVKIGDRSMIVSFERGKDELDRVLCDWKNEEGDIKGDWFYEDELTLIS